jgi:hypothetical protein
LAISISLENFRRRAGAHCKYHSRNYTAANGRRKDYLGWLHPGRQLLFFDRRRELAFVCRMKWFAAFLGIYIFSTAAMAQPFERSFSFDSGYFRKRNSDRAWENFGREWVDINAYALEQLNANERWGFSREGEFLLGSALGLYTMNVYKVSHHEFGHGSRLEALGYRTKYRSGTTGSTTRSAWQFFGRRFLDPFNDAYAVYSTSDREFTSPVRRFVNADGTLTNDGKILITTGGLNNSMAFAGSLGDRMRERGAAHYSEWLPYTMARLDATFYGRGSGDLSDLETYYSNKGVSISKTDMRVANLVGFALSASTWSYLLGTGEYATGGDPWVQGISYNDFALPDVENYLTTHGMSWKLSSGYRWDAHTYFPFAAEAVLTGAGQQEYSLGVRQQNWLWDDSSVNADLRLGSGVGLGLGFSQRLSEQWSLSLGWDHFNGRNLRGERNAVSFEDGESSDEIWARFSFIF